MYGMFYGCSGLTQINVPLNVKVDVELPTGGRWKDAAKTTYGYLPKGVTESFVITKTEE